MHTENCTRKIRRALIHSKDGIEEIARELVACGVELVSTGGTFTFLQELGLEVTAIEESPLILHSRGRVKTLHPKSLEEFLPQGTSRLEEIGNEC